MQHLAHHQEQTVSFVARKVLMATGELHQLSAVNWCENGCNNKFMCIDSEFLFLSL